MVSRLGRRPARTGAAEVVVGRAVGPAQPHRCHRALSPVGPRSGAVARSARAAASHPAGMTRLPSLRGANESARTRRPMTGSARNDDPMRRLKLLLRELAEGVGDGTRKAERDRAIAD